MSVVAFPRPVQIMDKHGPCVYDGGAVWYPPTFKQSLAIWSAIAVCAVPWIVGLVYLVRWIGGK